MRDEGDQDISVPWDAASKTTHGTDHDGPTTSTGPTGTDDGPTGSSTWPGEEGAERSVAATAIWQVRRATLSFWLLFAFDAAFRSHAFWPSGACRASTDPAVDPWSRQDSVPFRVPKFYFGAPRAGGVRPTSGGGRSPWVASAKKWLSDGLRGF